MPLVSSVAPRGPSGAACAGVASAGEHGTSGPASAASCPACARLRKTLAARTLRCLRRFRALARPSPGHLRSIRARPFDRVVHVRSLVGRTRFPSHPFTRWILPRRRQFGVGPATALLRPASGSLAAPLRVAEKMRLTDLCKPTCTTSTRRGRSISSARRPACAGRLVPGRTPLEAEASCRGPSSRRSEEALDGAPSASVSRACSPRRGEGRVPLGTVLRKRSFGRHAVWSGVFGRPRGEQVCL